VAGRHLMVDLFLTILWDVGGYGLGGWFVRAKGGFVLVVVGVERDHHLFLGHLRVHHVIVI
jgi:hypothetical protein